MAEMKRKPEVQILIRQTFTLQENAMNIADWRFEDYVFSIWESSQSSHTKIPTHSVGENLNLILGHRWKKSLKILANEIQQCLKNQVSRPDSIYPRNQRWFNNWKYTNG